MTLADAASRRPRLDIDAMEPRYPKAGRAGGFYAQRRTFLIQEQVYPTSAPRYGWLSAARGQALRVASRASPAPVTRRLRAPSKARLWASDRSRAERSRPDR